jgi:regulator of protease activity HflC (stomatin/prohibitin superfamily)
MLITLLGIAAAIVLIASLHSFIIWLLGKVVTIYEYQRGLLYSGGKFERVLEPGRYRVLPLTHEHIVVVDVRRTTLPIVNQRLLTADQIPVALNVSVDYEIADVEAAAHRVEDFRTQLYGDMQLAVRNVVGALTVDALLEQRDAINAQILAAVTGQAEGYGLRVLNVGIKDVILAGRVRDLLMKEAEARRVAQATLIGAREEVAALRALANAARLIEQHPSLLRLRELGTVDAFARTGGNTVVVGINGAIPLPHGNGKAVSTVEAEELAD